MDNLIKIQIWKTPKQQRLAKIKRYSNTCYWWGSGRTPSESAGGGQTSATPREGNLAISNKSTYAFTFKPAVSLLGIHPDDTPSIIHRHRFIHCCIVCNCKYWNRPKCPCRILAKDTMLYPHKVVLWNIKKNEEDLYELMWRDFSVQRAKHKRNICNMLSFKEATISWEIYMHFITWAKRNIGKRNLQLVRLGIYRVWVGTGQKG